MMAQQRFKLSAFFSGIQQLVGSHWLTGQCIFCGGNCQPQVDSCLDCEDALPLIPHHCASCALPLPSTTANLSKVNSGQLCGQCQQSPPPFSRTIACWLYVAPVAQLISDYKYRRKLSYGSNLAKLAIKTIKQAYFETEKPELIIATPLHWRRYWQRGFNQSELLASSFSKALQIPHSKVLKRKKITPNQQTLNAGQRQRNLHKAFEVTKPGLVRGRSIALIDDVMTTGSTATEISNTLLKAGAREVHIWVLARTPK